EAAVGTPDRLGPISRCSVTSWPNRDDLLPESGGGLVAESPSRRRTPKPWPAATAAGHHLVVPFRRPVTAERWLPGAAERLSSGLTSAVDLRRLGYRRTSPRMCQVAADAGWPIRRDVRGGRRRLEWPRRRSHI